MRHPTPFEIRALVAAAADWEGTPFADRGAVKGAGITCHHLPPMLYAEAGWLPRLEVPEGQTGWAASHGDSAIERWLDEYGRQYFAEITVADSGWPGDMIGFRMGRCVHHLAVVLPHGIIHSVTRLGVVIVPDLPASWHKRMERAWRPILL